MKHPPPAQQPEQPPPALSIPSHDGAFRADFHPSGRTEPNARNKPTPLYHLVLIRTRDGRAIADTRKTRHEAWLPTPDATQFDLSIPGDPDRHIAIDLRDSTCGEENFRGPTGPTLPLEQLPTLL